MQMSQKAREMLLQLQAMGKEARVRVRVGRG